MQLIKRHPAIGWVRGDMVPNETASQEILRLRNRIEDLEAKLVASRRDPPPGTEGLVQGEDEHILRTIVSIGEFSYNASRYFYDCLVSWNDIFSVVSPHLIIECTEQDMKDALSSLIRQREYKNISTSFKITHSNKLLSVGIEDAAFQTVKVQLRALGLIEKSTRNRSLKDTSAYWTLTEYGDALMNKLRAIRKQQIAEDTPPEADMKEQSA